MVDEGVRLVAGGVDGVAEVCDGAEHWDSFLVDAPE